jgi:hypothetical protein
MQSLAHGCRRGRRALLAGGRADAFEFRTATESPFEGSPKARNGITAAMGGNSVWAKGQPSKLSYLAYHEAGHAAVAFSFGLHLEGVWIHPPSDRGITKLTNAEQPTTLQHVLIALAGGRAEKRLDPSGSDRIASIEDEILALHAVSKCLRSHRKGRLDHYIDRLCDRTDSRLSRRCACIVDEHWIAIGRLAPMLAEHLDLTGEEAEFLLSGEGWS